MKLSGLRKALQYLLERGSHKNRDNKYLEMVEKLVDDTDSIIRLAPGYRKVLHEVVRFSIEYTEQLIDEIPQAMEIGNDAFVSNPQVNAFFVNTRELQTIFSQSYEIREFMDNNKFDSSHCYALLCMQKTEKAIMGVELSGDMLKHDVLQTAINFSDHRIYSPASTETETRQGLKQCLFNGLVTHAHEQVVRIKLEGLRLNEERLKLRALIREQQQQFAKSEAGSTANDEVADEVKKLTDRLSKIEWQIAEIQPVTPQKLLDQVVSVLRSPEEYVRFNQFSLHLTKMGIKVDEISKQSGNQLNLTEAEIGLEPPRVVTLVKFPRDELLSSSELMTGKLFSL